MVKKLQGQFASPTQSLKVRLEKYIDKGSFFIYLNMAVDFILSYIVGWSLFAEDETA